MKMKWSALFNTIIFFRSCLFKIKKTAKRNVRQMCAYIMLLKMVHYYHELSSHYKIFMCSVHIKLPVAIDKFWNIWIFHCAYELDYVIEASDRNVIIYICVAHRQSYSNFVTHIHVDMWVINLFRSVMSLHLYEIS